MRGILLSIALFASAVMSHGADWPTFRHDERRSGVSDESLTLPLGESWARLSPIPPMTAWSGPAKWDAYSGNDGLQSMRNFDPALFVTAVGDSVFFGSSIDHAAHCLNAADGKEKWVSFAGGAVRLPPEIVGDRAYFGADDGFAYCVDRKSGNEIWKHRAANDRRLIPSDGKLISPWPVRTGVLVRDGLAYFGASLVPWETSYLCAVDAASGERKLLTEHTGMTLQGAMLASTASLYVPQGRSVPLLFEFGTGKHVKAVGGAGGTFCLLTEDERLVAMPHNQKSAGDVIQVADPSGGSARLSFADADRLLVEKNFAYIHQRGKLRALDLKGYSQLHNEIRAADVVIKANAKAIGNLSKTLEATKKQPGKEAELKQMLADRDLLRRSTVEQKAIVSALKRKLSSHFLWEAEAPAPFDLIKAGGLLLVGGEDRVVAFDAKTGAQRWQGKVKGKCYGLAVASGRLFVSTSLGHIYCFASAKKP